MHLKKASITVEAALVLPLFLFLLINIISIFEMIHIHTVLDSALSSVGREISSYAPMVEDFENVLITEIYVKERVMEIAGRDKINHSVIIGGTKGIVLWRSELKENNDVIDLVMTYRVEPWLPVFGVGEMTLVNRCYVKTYTGYEEGDGSQNDKKYYVADTGEVYHLYRSCTHLQFSISQIEITELKNARNENGGKYKPCEICWDENTPQNRCYITTQGDRYHSSVSCAGLKRTIYIINASQIGNKPLCSRCGGQ